MSCNHLLCMIIEKYTIYRRLFSVLLRGMWAIDFRKDCSLCNDSKLKADINFVFFLLRRQTSKVYNWLQKFTIQQPVALL